MSIGSLFVMFWVSKVNFLFLRLMRHMILNDRSVVILATDITSSITPGVYIRVQNRIRFMYLVIECVAFHCVADADHLACRLGTPG